MNAWRPRIDPELRERVRPIAKRERRSLDVMANLLIEQALEEFLDDNQRRHAIGAPPLDGGGGPIAAPGVGARPDLDASEGTGSPPGDAGRNAVSAPQPPQPRERPVDRKATIEGLRRVVAGELPPVDPPGFLERRLAEAKGSTCEHPKSKVTIHGWGKSCECGSVFRAGVWKP